MTKEVKKFDAEVGKVLQLMIHSLYTNKEVAIRELISNASDACDKLKFLSQTDNSLIKDDPELKISIEINQEEKQIIITDNGIGMNKQDLDENLGTIARSGTQNFINQLTGDSKKDNMLIGQFGVGFYSAFMISDLITVKTKKAGESKAYTWFSNGNGEYTISDTDEDLPRGTQIILNIKPEDESFLDHFKLKHIVKSYSDHIATPIFFVTNEGETKLNLASAIWRRPKSEVLDSEYKDFYKSVSYSMDDPWMTIHNKNEGTIEYTNLLFIPSTKTFDLFHPDRKCRVKLYIKRVFIADEKIDVIPNYLRFIRGVVDSEDLPLNISRETLQHNSVLEKIKNSITKRVLSDLQKKKDEDRDSYQKFWDNFGAVLKEGLCEAISDHEKLLDVCLFRSALHNKFITLNEYIENAGENCKNIYFLSGDNPEKLINSPQIEGFLTKGIDVLLFTDTVDDFWVNVNNQYKGAELKSVTRSDIDLDEEGNQKSDQNQKHDKNDQSGTKDDQDSSQEHQELINFFKDTLGSAVKDVKLSKKLTSSPACLSAAAGAMDIRMERFLIEQKQLQSASAKVLEINPSHPIIKNMEDSIGKVDNQDHIKDLVHLMFDQACILEGEPLIDSSNFAKRINKLIEGLII